jgi:prepilin-type N-terminal cleavage/methylation domain-containing protein
VREKACNGMTLVELLIVLGLMAALAGMTMTSVTDMEERSRENATREGLAAIRAAVLGEAPGTPGFLADMGRYPRKAGSNGKELSQLWSPPANEYLYKKRVPDADRPIPVQYPGSGGATVSQTIAIPANAMALYAGWRGPYLHCPKGVFFDGFGNDWIVGENPEGFLIAVQGAVDADGSSGKSDLAAYPATISLTAYMRHNAALLTRKIETEIDSGGGDDSGGGGEEEGGGATAATAEYEYTYEYSHGQEEQWRMVASDSPDEKGYIRNDVVALKYVLFVPKEQDGAGFGIWAEEGDLAQGMEIETIAGSEIFWSQAKLYVYAVVAGTDPNGAAIRPRVLDCGGPITLDLRPGLNHFDVYLRHDVTP